MSELRYNIATSEWVIVAPERARRPEDFHVGTRTLTSQRAAHRPDCPFCPGGEENTPGETLRYCNDQGQWEVHSFPNRFPALRNDIEHDQVGDSFHRVRSGFGIHEVVVETPLHNATLALQPVAAVEQVVRAWRERYRAIAAIAGIEQVVVFKNHGPAAGCSLEHAHSQIVGLPVIPSPVRGRMSVALSYYRKHGRCVFCDMLETELKDQARIVASNADFVAFVPFAAYSPFSIWLFPRRHHHSFAKLADEQVSSLASLLKDILERLYNSLADPDYNLVVRSAHPPGPGSNYFHWYIAVVPRLAKLAGFELGTGMFINGSSPEGDAASLRSCTTVHG